VSSGLKPAQKAEKRIDKIFRSIAAKLVENFRPDLLHINSSDSHLLEVRGLPKIFVIHGGLDFVKDERSFCKEMWKVYSKVDAIVTPSRHAAKNLRGLCGIDSRVIQHGVDVELFNPFTISKHNARRRLKIDPEGHPRESALAEYIGGRPVQRCRSQKVWTSQSTRWSARSAHSTNPDLGKRY